MAALFPQEDEGSWTSLSDVETDADEIGKFMHKITLKCDERVKKPDSENSVGSSEDKGSSSLVYEGQFVRFGRRLDNIGSFVEENKILECLVQEIYDPLDFYVNLVDYWNQLECFQKNFNAYYNKQDWAKVNQNGTGTLQRHYLVPGMYVAVKFTEEWFRCQIKSYNPTTKMCRVIRIDYGFETDVPDYSIRLLHSHYFHTFKAQAINCRLRFHPSHLNYITKVMNRNKQNKRTMAKILEGVVLRSREVIVKFLKSHPLTNDDFIWDVDINLIDRVNGQFVEVSREGDVAHIILKKLEKLFPPKDFGDN